MSMNDAFKDVDHYISLADPAVQGKLKQLRKILNEEVPEAQEAIKYGMPTLVFHGNMFSFGAYKHHIGFYPWTTEMEREIPELKPYAKGSGTTQFPLDRELPEGLIRKMAKMRKAEMIAKKK